jgi:acyl-CoA thioester hydrolase
VRAAAGVGGLSASLDLTKRESFSYFHREQIRFSDTDMLGHVNNVAYAAMVESGRIAYLRSVVSRLYTVMARIEIDYRAELHYPAEIDVGCVILRVGRSSIVLGNGVFDGNVCGAAAVTTLVLIDKETRRSTPIPDEARAQLEVNCM